MTIHEYQSKEIRIEVLHYEEESISLALSQVQEEMWELEAELEAYDREQAALDE